MTRWKIVGASRSSAAPVELSIDAPTLAEAEQQASEMGVLISTIKAERAAEMAVIAKPVYIPAKPEPEQPSFPQAPSVQTIERTSKKYKANMAWGCSGFLICFLIGLIVTLNKQPELGAWLWIASFLCLVWFIAAKVSAWWDHG